MTDDDEPFEVGYGKPPADHQFKQGQSGNPRGRPNRKKAAAPDSMDIINQVISMPVTTLINGKRQKVPALKAAVLQLVQRALQNDDRALRTLLQLVSRRAGEQKSAVEGVKRALAVALTDPDALDQPAREGLIRAAESTRDADLIIEVQTQLARRAERDQHATRQRILDAVRAVQSAEKLASEE